VPLRVRATVAFGLVSLMLAGAFGVVTHVLVRSWAIADRENAAVRQAYTNARLVRNRLRSPGTDIPALLSGLQFTGTGVALIQRQGRWYTSSVDADRSGLTPSLRAEVGDGRAARQVVRGQGGPSLLIGVPIAEASADFYVIESLQDLESTLAGLRTAFLAGTAVAAAVGATTGALISRRVLRPLTETSRTATLIASGESAARLPATNDPDLEPLTTSFNDMVDRLVARARREARFASDVSHDLRGPLATLSAAVSVIKRRRDQVPETARAAIDALDDQVESFNRLVVDLLEISRFEAGTAVLDRRNVDLEEFVRVVLRDSEAHHDIPIDTAAASSMRAEIDPRRIQQVLLNLLDNADRYAGGATRIEITRPATGRVSIAVEDRGPGVPSDLRDAIFDRYERGPAAQDPEMPDGTGLGLALAAQHVALHHGSIHVEPNSGGGSRFVIELPEDA